MLNNFSHGEEKIANNIIIRIIGSQREMYNDLSGALDPRNIGIIQIMADFLQTLSNFIIVKHITL